MKYLFTIVLLIFGFCPVISAEYNFDNATGNNLAQLFGQSDGQDKIKAFIDNVLKQGDATRFIKLVSGIVRQSPNIINKELYQKSHQHIFDIKPYFFSLQQFKALRHQQDIISSQIRKSLPAEFQAKVYVEIGTPGTYINNLKANKIINGKVYVLNSSNVFFDRIHCLSWNPFKGFKSYDQFVPLNNYDAILEKDIPPASVDLVTCVIGLHHILPEKIKGFVESIYRILKPGGIFILRDHDSKDDETKSIIQAAHSIYNMISSNLDVEGEIAEFRNFQSIDYWVQFLNSVGFHDSGLRKLQEGDPTLNTIMSFIKPHQTIEDIEQSCEQIVDFVRDPLKTNLSHPEWCNVLAAIEYANFIQHSPFYEFPYMSSVASFWDVFRGSWAEARKTASFWKVLTADYTVMNLFVGVFMTIEYTVKAIISAPIRFFMGGDEPRTMKLIITDPENDIDRLFPEAKRIKMFSLPSKQMVNLVEVPRYRKFEDFLQKFSESSQGNIVSISGQKSIQITLKHSKNIDLKKIVNPPYTVSYTWDFPTFTDKTFTVVTVACNKIKEAIQYFKHQQAEIFVIHDY